MNKIPKHSKQYRRRTDNYRPQWKDVAAGLLNLLSTRCSDDGVRSPLRGYASALLHSLVPTNSLHTKLNKVATDLSEKQYPRSSAEVHLREDNAVITVKMHNRPKITIIFRRDKVGDLLPTALIEQDGHSIPLNNPLERPNV